MPDYLAGQWPEGAKDDEDAFFKALWPDNWQTDHLGAILRGMAYIDALLLTILQNELKNPNAINLDRRQFMEKARLAHAVGAIDSAFLASLGQLAKIRNGFAHDIGRQLNHAEVIKLCNSLDGRVLELFLCYTGGASKSPQRIRHAIAVLKLALEEIAYPEKPRDYPWFDAELAARRFRGTERYRAQQAIATNPEKV